MKHYLAVFTGTAAGRAQWDQLDADTRKQREQQGLAAWGKWMQDHASVIVDTGGPLGKTKRTSKAGIEDISNNLAGYVKLQAESQQAAAELFKDHPHFSIFPGDGVEVMEVLPIPGKS